MRLTSAGLIALLALLLLDSQALAEPLPRICTELPENFEAERTSFLDGDHREIVRRARSLYADSGSHDKELKAIRDRLRRRIAVASKTNSYDAAVLRVEMLFRPFAEDLSKEERTKLRSDLRRTLTIDAPTAAGAEALATIEADENVEAGSGEVSEKDNEIANALAERNQRLQRAIADHRRFHGDTPRQFLLWTRLYKTVVGQSGKLQTARQILAASEGMGPQAVLRARLTVFRHLPASDPERATLAGLIVDDALTAAGTQIPPKGVVEKRSCYTSLANFTNEFIEAFNLTQRKADRKRFLALAVQHMATLVPFGTHDVFVLQDISQVLAAREVDFEAFLAAMARLDTNDDRCKEPEKPATLCGLLAAAENLLANNEPSLGITLLQDAMELAQRDALPAALTWRIQIALAESQWRYSAKSLAAAEIDKIDVSRIETTADQQTLAQFHRLRAEIADAMLQPSMAAQSFGRLIDLALAVERLPEDREPPGAYLVKELAGEMVWRLLEGRFCASCGGSLRDPALRWIKSGLVAKHFLKADAIGEKLLAQRYLEKRWPELADRRQFDKAFIGALGEYWKPLVDVIRKRWRGQHLQLADETRVLAAILIPAGDPRLNTVETVKKQVDDYALFIVETNQERQEAAWVDLLPGDDPYTSWRNERNGRFAFHLANAGFADAADAVLVAMTNIIEADDDEKDGFERFLGRAQSHAAFWGSAYARQAQRDIERSKWQDANGELDSAQRILLARINQEWTTSSERIAPLLRELGHVIQPLAEMRVTVAATAPIEHKIFDRAFEAIQLAIVGETAAGLQASQRRRLLADSQVASIALRRDEAKSSLELAEGFARAVGVIDSETHDHNIARLKKQLADLESELAARLPGTETIGSLRPLELNEAQAMLRPDEALVLLHASQGGIYGCAIGPNGDPQFWRSRVSAEELERQVSELRRGLDVQGGLPIFPSLLAHELYASLFGPIEPILQRTKHLLVSADGPLNAMPLSVLVRQRPSVVPKTAADYAIAHIGWLGRSHAITILPVPRALESRRAKRLASRAPLAFAGIGNPVLADTNIPQRGVDYASIYRRGPLADVELLRKLPSLPETETEIRAVANLLGAREQDLFLGTKATVPSVRNNGLGKYRVIMFSTHGAMGGELRGLSEPGLILTPPETASASDDGVLTASEITNLKIDADLVILSACNTASSDGRPHAEGFSGLTRAFLRAGARSVVVTHWSIPSIPAVEVTTKMIMEHTREGKISWSEALRRSTERLAKGEGDPSFAHPSNWGAFVVVGAETIAD